MGCQDSVTSSTVYGDTISFSEIMDNQYSVTGAILSSPEINGSQDSVISRTVYGYTTSFFDFMGSQYSVTEPLATHSPFPRSWVVNTTSRAIWNILPFWISWAVNTPSPGHMATHSSFSVIMSSYYSVTVHMATLSPFPRSWVVNTPSPGHMATHSPFWISWAVKTPSLGIWPNILISQIMASQDSVTSRCVYGDTISFSEIMGSK
ncbi:hypothetical protein BgiBS90_015888 [Biomphalaria glabrata]|nr:hypothetical protein BgiBS90_015888 [Biomphalaria glabrata]